MLELLPPRCYSPHMRLLLSLTPYQRLTDAERERIAGAPEDVQSASTWLEVHQPRLRSRLAVAVGSSIVLGVAAAVVLGAIGFITSIAIQAAIGTALLALALQARSLLLPVLTARQATDKVNQWRVDSSLTTIQVTVPGALSTSDPGGLTTVDAGRLTSSTE